jgi:hypothetical protein
MRLRRLLRRISKLRGLTRREWADLWRAQWWILRAQIRLRHADEGALLSQWTTAPPVVPPGRSDSGAHARAIAIGDAVRRAGLFGFTRPRCLARSLAISSLLAREGISGSAIRVGVRYSAGRLEAHAWVEHDGEVIGDSAAHIRRFREFVTAQPVGG